MAEDKSWQEWLGTLTSTVTATILLASGGTLIAVGQQQVRINTQIETITKLVDTLSGKVDNKANSDEVNDLESRVRNLEIQR
ncbi:MAG: hypothetical protein EBZ44_04965 [Verrucomicrobia bacterium]|jgi:hypothetical protein|nr:hypothetical protein [bacterium]NDA10240.1 hypothetical protein [Verrucomicrobiota bacterium]NDA25891.1 hypothetical protein [Verrucomicrobiota bacterium]NDD57054.1 hypothetical protein [Verrucomicrobiota bacterium]NDD81703.1 hypothetical protein [Verrucomicrobiota bacterium]